MTLERATFALPVGTVHALVGGDVTARPLVFLHGFPDHPPTATPFLEQLARTHRVIAPWLRGYAPSPIVGPYDLETLAADVTALIDLHGGEVDLVGHDWGGAITYAVCASAPSRVRRAVTLAIPHPATFLRSLAYSRQWRRSWYMGLFQLPGAGHLVKARELALIDRLWRTWSPGFTLDPARRTELHACLAASLPAALAYYRAILRPVSTLVDRLRRAEARITTPLLQLHGADDGCIVPPTEADARWFAARVRARDRAERGSLSSRRRPRADRRARHRLVGVASTAYGAPPAGWHSAAGRRSRYPWRHRARCFRRAHARTGG